MISIIAAVSANGIIGIDGKLPFHYSKDLKFFKQCTSNSVVVMGRNTYESMNCKPLPNRDNIILTREFIHIDHPTSPVVSENTYEKAIDTAKRYSVLNDSKDIPKDPKDIWIIGGASLYEQALYSGVDRIVLTVTPDFINQGKESTIKFPWINPTKYKLDEHYSTIFDNEVVLKVITYSLL